MSVSVCVVCVIVGVMLLLLKVVGLVKLIMKLMISRLRLLCGGSGVLKFCW